MPKSSFNNHCCTMRYSIPTPLRNPIRLPESGELSESRTEIFAEVSQVTLARSLEKRPERHPVSQIYPMVTGVIVIPRNNGIHPH